MKHILYKTGDDGAPRAIMDKNREVVLDLCKVCGQGEGELGKVCPGSPLHQEPERDQFKSESPIRAFTTWSVEGLYALGKGFRPSLHHLVPYLNALESKEGWRLVQVLEAGSQTPSFIFRCDRVTPPVMPEITAATVSTGLRQVTGQMRSLIEHKMESDKPLANGDNHGFTLESIDQWADRIDGYARHLNPPVPTYNFEIDPAHLEAPHTGDRDGYVHRPGAEGFAEAAARMDEAQQVSDAMDDPVNPAHYNGTACAEIIENMPGNIAHAITYIWRAGDKPDQPEIQEIEKALWYLNREHAERYGRSLPGQSRYMDWTLKYGFKEFAMSRLPDDMPRWRYHAIKHLIVFCISQDRLDLGRASRRLGNRIDWLKIEAGCPDDGRGLQP